MLNNASLILAVMGLVSIPFGAIRGWPFAVPAMTRKISPPMIPIGLATGFLAGWLVLPVAMSLFSSEHKSVMSALQVSTSPLIFIIASMFTILTVYISTRKPAKRAAKVSPLEAVRYTEQGNFKRKPSKRTQGAKLSRMALSNFGRNKRRSVFIIISLLLCIVFVNSAVVITQSIDEEKFIRRNTKTDYTVYNSIVAKCLRLEGSNFRLGGIAPITRAVPSF